MAPRFQTMPAPKTESAREAARTFYCELCTKGYARMPEYEAHLSSYEHTHNQRRKDAKQFHKNPLGKDPSEASKRNEEREKKAAGMTSVKVDSGLNSGTPAKGFKKGGFKSAGFKKVETKPVAGALGALEERNEPVAVIPGPNPKVEDPQGAASSEQDVEEDEGEDQSNDYSFWCATNPGYDYYDPLQPGGCNLRCGCQTSRLLGCQQDCELCLSLEILSKAQEVR